MVLVAPLVVHPRLGIALVLALGGIGAAVALIIADAGPEFGGRIFGQIVRQALPVEPHAEAAAAHEPAVMRDGFEMLPDVAHVLCLPGRNFPHLYYKYSGMKMQLPRFSRANRSVCIET